MKTAEDYTDKSEEREKMSQEEKEAILPEVGKQFKMMGSVWKVTYINLGNMRFSAEWVRKTNKATKLDVQGGSFTQKSKFTKG